MIFAMIAALIFAFLVDDKDKCSTSKTEFGVGYSPFLFMAQWGMCIFLLHLLTITFAMLCSTLFVSSHGSKVVFVIWAVNLMPCLGWGN